MPNVTRSIMARQPILNRSGAVHGYEILYRRQDASLSAPLDSTEERRSLLNVAVEIGLDRLVGERLAFFNLSPELLFDERVELLPPERVVFELLEDTRLTPQSQARVIDLRKKGYRIAYDDFTFEAHQLAFVGLVDLIKIDLVGTDWRRIAGAVSLLKSKGAILLAEKVEDHETYARCFKAGFDLFQGYYFSHPETLAGRRVNAGESATLRLISILSDPKASVSQVTDVIAHDTGLTSRVLALASSASVNASRAVDSLHVAVQILGARTLQALATLLAASERSPKNSSVLSEMGFVRARVCEGVSKLTGRGDPQAGFTVGLLSVLDAMMNLPLESLLDELGLSSELTAILRDPQSNEGLRIATAMERGDWQAISAISLDMEALSAIYWKAVEDSAVYRTGDEK